MSSVRQGGDAQQTEGTDSQTAGAADKAVRIFALAKELSAECGRTITSKDVLEVCRRHGIEGVTNQFHGVTVEQGAAIRKHFTDDPQEDNELLQAALSYADLGYEVFPTTQNWPPGAIPDDKLKSPLTPHGHLDATTDVATIKAWWTRFPRANVAIRCKGMVVIDRDPGNEWLADTPELAADLLAGPQAITPRGGYHHYFRVPDGKAWRKTESLLAPKIDTRCHDGYVLVCPSRVNDKPYRWADDADLGQPLAELPQPPEWLITELDRVERQRGEKNTSKATGEVGENDIPDGQRDCTLASRAGTMRRVGFSIEAIEAALLILNAERCKPPLDEKQVRKIARSIGSKDPDAAASAPAGDGALGLEFEKLSAIPVRSVKWLVPGRIPYGKTTLIAGRGGSGKSTLTRHIVARITTGRAAFGLDYDAPPPRGVIMMSSEDGIEDTVNPSLIGEGANLDLVELVYHVRTEQNQKRNRVHLGVEHLPMLRDKIRERRHEIDCLIVDPIVSLISRAGLNDNNKVELRKVLDPLSELADSTGIAAGSAHLKLLGIALLC